MQINMGALPVRQIANATLLTAFFVPYDLT
jgi:hypothetical protein